MALYGRQAIAELHGCNPRSLDDPAILKGVMTRAAEASGAHIVDVVSHKFAPQGASVVVVIAESHISIHTWPEHRFAAVDIFSCSTKLDLTVAWECISRDLEAREVICKVLPRLQHDEGPSVGTDSKRALHLLMTKDGQMLEVDERICRRQTRWQTLELVRTRYHGTCLLLDQIPQSSEKDEFIYHEALVHPAMLAHPRPRRVLVIGGGEGATAREALRHPSVEKVVMVDLDEEVVNFCRDNLPQWHQGAFSDPRLELVFADGRSYLDLSQEKFDCVLVDLTDVFPITPASRLYTREFYELVRDNLTPEGILATHAEGLSPVYLEHHLRAISTLREVFTEVVPYRAFVPVFSQEWAFAAAGMVPRVAALTEEEVDRRLAERGIDKLRYYDGVTHQAMVTMPKYIRRRLAEQVPPLTDEEIDGVLSRAEPVSMAEG